MSTGDKRMDVVTPRPGSQGKTFWHRVGTAWVKPDGKTTIYLDSVPVPDASKDNKIVMMLFEPREQTQAPAKNAGGKKDLDDEIPF